MDLGAFAPNAPGRIIKSNLGYSTYTPNPLPRKLPLSEKAVAILSDADRALGELSGAGRYIPNPNLLITPYLKKEAVLSSKIEGTQTTLPQMFLFEVEKDATEVPRDIKEVTNYVTALQNGVKRLKDIPLSLRLIRDLHRDLMKDVRGGDRALGEFRKAQNMIGAPGVKPEDARFLPPAPEVLDGVLKDFELFLNTKGELPPLIQCALMHYQFETIHPFMDGNGRIGRLLIPLFLLERKLLPTPLFYLSAYFESRREEYYDLLLQVSQKGDWESWINFFLNGVITQSKDAITGIGKLFTLREKYISALLEAQASATSLSLVDLLFKAPAVSAPYVELKLKVTFPTAQNAIGNFVERGWLKELTGKKRGRVYMAGEILRTLDQAQPENPAK